MKPELKAFAPAIGWGLAVAAVAVGYMNYGWPGVALALSVVVFWLLLQFSRAMRAMRTASGRPVGEVANAVMLHARLAKGQRLADIFKLTRSLGTVVSTAPEVFAWRDAGGDSVEVTLHDGRVSSWRLQRAQADTAGEPANEGAAPGA